MAITSYMSYNLMIYLVCLGINSRSFYNKKVSNFTSYLAKIATDNQYDWSISSYFYNVEERPPDLSLFSNSLFHNSFRSNSSEQTFILISYNSQV